MAAYFGKYGMTTKNRLVGEQGYIIHKPGEIIIEIEGDYLYVGGYAVDFGQRELEI